MDLQEVKDFNKGNFDIITANHEAVFGASGQREKSA